jgi:molybdopterin-guanine dinucleotide biosynthesis protein A
MKTHDHPCGICTRLAPCSCDYPAVSTDFVCDQCHERATANFVFTLRFGPDDMDTLMAVLHAVRADQTSRGLGDRLQAILDRVVIS